MNPDIDTPRFFAEAYPTRESALARIQVLEDELAACAQVLQRLHPIGAVKGIGLLECAEALRQVESEIKAKESTHV